MEGEAASDPAAVDGSSGGGKWLLVPAALFLLAGAGYGGYRGVKYYRDKKRGYVK